MKLNQKIHINILEFFKTGRFDYLELGQTKEWIINNFPDPDGIESGEKIKNTNIWCYGNLELHFYNHKLFLIFSDYIETLSGGDSIDFDKWILDKPQELILEKVVGEFNKLKIDFSITHKINLDQVELEIIESKVKLTFHGEEEEDANKFKLVAFSLSADTDTL